MREQSLPCGSDLHLSLLLTHSLGVTDPTNTLGLGLSATFGHTTGLGSGARRWTAGGGGAVSVEGRADPTLDALLASVAEERKKR